MKGVKKSDLPQKVCATCGRPFTWRKKWEKVWDEVKYCSDRCRGQKSSKKALKKPVICSPVEERKTGLEPATYSLGSCRSTR